MVELRHRNLRDVDWLLLLTPIALTVLGCIGIHSTAPNQEFKKQLVALGIGIVAAVAIMLIDYRKIVMNIAPFFYGGTMLLLVGVLFFGKEVNHNKAWLNIGVSIQPSEFAKIATILMLARFMSQARGDLKLKEIIL